MKKLIILAALLLNISYAQLSFDRTRVIFDHSKSNSQSVVVSNNNKTAPYLAQSWIEDENGVKIMAPLVALPILQRINPNQEKQIRISLAGDATQLPRDRESLLYFNVLGVPPKEGNDDNVISIVLQSKLKLFFRPKGLQKYSTANGWFEEMNVRKNGNTLILENPSPYHIVIYGFKNQSGSKPIEKDVIVKPFSNESVNIKLGNTPEILFVNDFGGAEALSYRCDAAGSCEVIKKR